MGQDKTEISCKVLNHFRVITFAFYCFNITHSTYEPVSLAHVTSPTCALLFNKAGVLQILVFMMQ